MPKTQQSGKQPKSTAGTGFGDSKSSPKESSGSKLEAYINSIRGTKITKTKLRNEIQNILFDGATEEPEIGKWYFFEYDPKFRDMLKMWDQFPFIRVLEKRSKGHILGANLHYLKTNTRLNAINKNSVPNVALHYYIPKRADNIFFEVEEADVQLMSQLPIEKFHRK